MIKPGFLLLLCLALFCQSPKSRAANWSANIQYLNEYIFRGVPQASNSFNGGLKFENDSWYAGTWAADVKDGIELNVYGGYTLNMGQDWSLGVGGTWYTYTGDFDDDYKEVNLLGSWRWLSLNVDWGTYDNFNQPSQTYLHSSLTAQYKGMFARYGLFERDFDGAYAEAGYANSLVIKQTYWLDYTLSLVYSNATLLGGASDTNFVVGIGRSFNF